MDSQIVVMREIKRLLVSFQVKFCDCDPSPARSPMLIVSNQSVGFWNVRFDGGQLVVSHSLVSGLLNYFDLNQPGCLERLVQYIRENS